MRGCIIIKEFCRVSILNECRVCVVQDVHRLLPGELCILRFTLLLFDSEACERGHISLACSLLVSSRSDSSSPASRC